MRPVGDSGPGGVWRWGGVHRWLGLATVVVFLASGQYMRLREPPVAELETGLRMLFRSRHIYLLLIGLLNLAVGLGLVAPPGRVRRWLAVIGSVLLALAPALALAAFFIEAEGFGAPGPLAILAVEAAFAGCVLHAAAAWPRRRA